MVDATTFYIVNLEIYSGKQPVGPYALRNKAFGIVDRLVAPISKTNRNVTFDNWFTSYPLMLHLLGVHKLTSTGTVRRNKVELRNEMLVSKTTSLWSHVCQKSKEVLVMSTLHDDNRIDNDTLAKNKPEMVTFYSKTKCGVDVVDELRGVSRNIKRCPKVIFYAILNVAGINSLIVFIANNNSSSDRHNFLRNLGMNLIMENSQK